MQGSISSLAASALLEVSAAQREAASATRERVTASALEAAWKEVKELRRELAGVSHLPSNPDFQTLNPDIRRVTASALEAAWKEF